MTKIEKLLQILLMKKMQIQLGVCIFLYGGSAFDALIQRFSDDKVGAFVIEIAEVITANAVKAVISANITDSVADPP